MNVVIMAGGKGTRFWPRSVDSMPKQFLPFHSERTLIQETVSRFRKIVSSSRLYIIAPARYLPLLEEQLPEFTQDQLILEPEQKDTAACIALAAFRFQQRGDDEPAIFVPSDQYIAEEEPFLAAVRRAAEMAKRPGAIVTLGIEPTRPETGFGYMKTKEPAAGEDLPDSVLPVLRFMEKPTAERAEKLIREPGTYWNSGIFVCKPSTLARRMEQFQPAIWNSLIEHPLDVSAAYALMPRLSIDFAVMERAESMYCIPVQCGWDDIGSWAVLGRHWTPDANGNVSKGSVTLTEASGNTVFIADKHALIIGVHDLIIVSTPSGLLVCPKTEEFRLRMWLK
ncbi:NTP transferase domain-containing protein [Paenibacillus sp. sptzw28]|uniref:mannose-1-phosphate guanylyltransferase n=1 Tax=Paenibacillus sp. sptzw28 TaxID=715179 RepID=UPI001C6EACDD|nr:sugar phosphate nucleotidyltransferase [Paenibacillus sp. sptzw28]QYR20549.1 NTP transferase domain-containing protein [Paenibacillus sp. sptzw28]